jgi:hypothetical protein
VILWLLYVLGVVLLYAAGAKDDALQELHLWAYFAAAGALAFPAVWFGHAACIAAESDRQRVGRIRTLRLVLHARALQRADRLQIAALRHVVWWIHHDHTMGRWDDEKAMQMLVRLRGKLHAAIEERIGPDAASRLFRPVPREDAPRDFVDRAFRDLLASVDDIQARHRR